MTIQYSEIELEQMTFFARHGALPQETEVGALFTVDLRLIADLSCAVASDELTHTIHYGIAYDIVRHEMEQPSQLLEHVCGRIAQKLFDAFDMLQEVHVRVSKQRPPISGADCKASAVTLRCHR